MKFDIYVSGIYKSIVTLVKNNEKRMNFRCLTTRYRI